MTDEELKVACHGPRPPWWRPFARRKWDRHPVPRNRDTIEALIGYYKRVYARPYLRVLPQPLRPYEAWLANLGRA